MHAAHARNSDQEFLELELYHDFSRCNPNSHEICMSQIARYVDDRINGGSFSSHLRYWEAGKRGDSEARERDRGATARGRFHAIFTRFIVESTTSFPIVLHIIVFLSCSSHTLPYISTIDFVYAARSYPICQFLPFGAVSSAMIYGRDNAREREATVARVDWTYGGGAT